MTVFPTAWNEHPRFTAKISVGPDTACWEWTGSRFRLGYGSFGFNGKVRSAHRVAWEITNGPVPAGMSVCHACDNRRCVNPAHLFLGTHAENMADASSKGRMRKPRGEGHPSAKVTDEQVKAIRELRRSGFLLREIAANYGLGITHVHRIVKGESR